MINGKIYLEEIVHKKIHSEEVIYSYVCTGMWFEEMINREHILRSYVLTSVQECT
jgi:hypothetical protein